MHANLVSTISHWHYLSVLCNLLWQTAFVIKTRLNEFNALFCDKEVLLWLRDKQMSDKLMEFCMCMESIRTTIFQNLSLSAYLHFKLEIFVNKFINFSVSVCLSQSTHLIHSFITPVFNKHSYHFSKTTNDLQ